MVADEKLNIGLFGIGLDTYWPQFPGLHERLEGYQREIAQEILSSGAVNLIDAGLVDNPERAKSVGSLFRQQQVDVIFLYISTYALSSTVLPVAQAAGVPIVVLNIQPVAAIDYEAFNSLGDRGKMTGEWLAHCQACSVPEIANVFNRAGIKYHLLTGYLGEPRTNELLKEWVAAAKVAGVMKNNRLGVMGHYYAGMLDVYTDITRQIGVFGGHVDLIEIDELVELRNGVTDREIAGKLGEFDDAFTVSAECDAHELQRAARTSVALDKLVAKGRLGSLAYYYEGTAESAHEEIVTSVIAGNTLLTGRHVPVSGECEIKNAQAMKILDSFGAGGSFSEFYAIDFTDDIVMLGHDGPAHFGIAEGDVGLVPLPVYHGKPGKGLSIQMTVKHGPVTLLSVCEGPESVFLLVAEGESVSGPVLQIGNTNSRYKFSLHARDFIEQWSNAGPSHHCAIGVGHVASRLEKFGQLTGIPVERVC
ncbi:MAG: L-fucose/L-arabinose isomerase family protein [Spirochaetia bacterium]